MRNLSVRFIKCVIGLSVALIAVSNCFNVLSNSPGMSADDAHQRAIATSTQYNSTFSAPRSADNRQLASNREGTRGARAELAAPASAFSPFAPNITATKSHTPAGSANPGDTLTYSIVISNSGSDATGVNFTDTIDPNTTLVGGSVKASPIAVADAYNTIGNVNISVPAAQGVVANDSNSGFGTLSVTMVNATAVPGTASTANGSVTMNSDGSFSYTPNVAFRGPSDSFTYTLANGSGFTDTATVTISVNGLIWFVNAAAAPGGDGRLSTPFNCLVGPGCFDPAAADIANDNIFVYTGAYTGGVTLLSGQKLIGQGAGDTLINITALTQPSGTNLLPSTGGTSPTIVAAGANVTLGSGNTIRGVALNGTAGVAVDLTGTGFGTATIAEMSLGGVGRALNLSTGTLTGPVSSTAAFTSISSTGSSTTGVTLTSVGGAMSSGSTSVTTSSGVGIQVQSAPVGASLGFGPTTVTGSGGTGVRLIDNVGNVAFGSLSITPVANQRGLHATNAVLNSGTITTTSGSITTTGAIAVEVNRTSAGTIPLIMSLGSVTATGGPNGIVLTNTSGSFTVNGDGTNTAVGGNGSGGTISGMTGADGAVAGTAVYLNNATNVALRRMTINGTNQNFGIRGFTVNGFTLEYATVGGVAGTNASIDSYGEGSIYFGTAAAATGLTGSGTVTNCNISGGRARNLSVVNTSGTLNRLTITGTTFGLNQNFTDANQSLAVEARNSGTVANVTVTGSTFTGSPGDLANFTGQTSTSMNVIFQNNVCSNNHAQNVIGGGGFTLATSGSMDFNASNNSFRDANGSAITLQKGSTGTSLNGTLNNNTIGVTGVTNSGSATANGIFFSFAGSGAILLNITNNDIRQYGGNAGIFADNNGGSYSLDLTVTGNTTAEPGAGGFAGLALGAGTSAGDTITVCANVTGNDFSTGDPSDTFDVYTLVSSSGSFLRLPGLVTSGTEANRQTQIQNFILANNNVAGTQVFADISAPATYAANYIGGAACSMATMSAHPIASISSAGHQSDNEPSSSKGNDELRSARGQAPPDEFVQKLRQEDLNWTVQAAIERWRQAKISEEDLARLAQTTFTVERLSSGQLASSTAGGIFIDETAAGYGWFFDQTPSEDSEFDVVVLERERQTTDLSVAHGKMDLLTVVMRELGTVYIQGKNRVPKQIRPLMEPTLSPSVRRMPEFNVPDRSTSSLNGSPTRNNSMTLAAPSQAKSFQFTAIPAIFNSSAGDGSGSYGRSAKRMSYAPNARRIEAPSMAPFSGETVTLNIGTIPAGESVTITFQVTVDNPFPNGVCNVSNQGHVTGSNFSQVDTNIDVTPVNKAVTIGACPANITTNTEAGVCTAVVTFSTPTSDGCPAPTVTCSPASGTAFGKGVTTVTCTATNGTPPDATCTFTVTVNDAQAPTITCPANVTQGTDPSVCTAVVTYANATATDNCPGVGTPVCTPASGTTFNKGTTTVSCTVSDASSNSANCSFTVTVNDTIPPTISCPANVVHSTDPNVCNAAVTYANATATDNCPGVGTPVCAPASGSTFSIGVTTVTCNVSDASSNSANCSFTVTVKDTQAPNLGPCPANISVNSSGGCQVVTYSTPTATDNCGSATVVCSPPSGFCFAPGTTTVTCTASDTSPDSPDTSCSFMVTVVPCTITCPSNISVNNTPNLCGAAVTYAPSFGAGCGTVICSPSSGAFFPVGTTTVTCTTMAGPACSFTVTVVDAQPPTITTCPPNRTLSTNGGSQIALPSLTGEVVATDNCTPSGSLVITQSPVAGTMIGLGTTLVTITVKDAANNQSTCIVTITVVKFAAKDFVVFSSEFTKLNANATVNTGNVGANTSLPDPNGPPDDKEEVEIGERVTMLQAGSSVVGDTVRLRANSSIYNVYFNESFFSPSATILGSQVTPLSLPVTTMPAFPTVTPGTIDVVVPANSTVTLAPGSYRNVTVNNKGTLKLTGGLYQVSSLDIRQEANIFCLAQTEVRVKIEMDTDAKAFIGPDASVPSLQASQIIFYVEGADGGGGLSPTAVQIGERNTVVANIYAVNGTVVLKANTIATGAFFGKQAQIGERVELTLKSAF